MRFIRGPGPDLFLLPQDPHEFSLGTIVRDVYKFELNQEGGMRLSGVQVFPMFTNVY